MQTPYRFDETIHLHSYEGKPLTGTSSVSDVLAKPLVWWAAGLAVQEFGVPNGKLLTKIKNKKATPEEIEECMASVEAKLEQIKLMSPFEFFVLCDDAYRAHTRVLKDSAQAGTDMHALLEAYIKECIAKGGEPFDPDPSITDPRVILFASWANQKVKKFLWSEVHCYSLVHWIGGISDVGFEDKEGKLAILDFKSSKEAYVSQFWQCAGYDIEISENGGFDAEGNLLFKLDRPIDYYVVLPYGMEMPTPQYYYDVANGHKAFLAELTLYKLLPKDR